MEGDFRRNTVVRWSGEATRCPLKTGRSNGVSFIANALAARTKPSGRLRCPAHSTRHADTKRSREPDDADKIKHNRAQSLRWGETTSTRHGNRSLRILLLAVAYRIPRPSAPDSGPSLREPQFAKPNGSPVMSLVAGANLPIAAGRVKKNMRPAMVMQASNSGYVG